MRMCPKRRGYFRKWRMSGFGQVVILRRFVIENS